jgi:hypothetical protein
MPDRARRALLSTTLVWLALAPTDVAHAGNDDELFVGNQAAMVGGAVAATVMDTSATWYNPAGLGAVERDQLDISATVYTLRLYAVPGLLSTRDGDSENGTVNEFVAAPAQAAYTRRLGPGVSLGLGYFVPRASSFVLREALVAGGRSSGSSWQIAGAVSEIQHNAAAALGFALTPKLRLGVSLIGSYSAQLQSVALFGAIRRSGQPVGSTSATTLGSVARFGLEAGLGVQLDLTRELTIALAARSPRLQVHARVDASVNQTTTALEEGEAPRLTASADELRERNGATLMRAGRANLALAYRYADGYVAIEADVQPGLRSRKGEIDRKPTVNARVGWYQTLSEALAIGFGLFSDRSAERSSWSFVSGSGDSYGVSVGLELGNEHTLAPGEPVDSLIFGTVVALRYAYSEGDFGRALADPAKIEAPFTTLRGTLQVHELGLYLGSGLQF